MRQLVRLSLIIAFLSTPRLAVANIGVPMVAVFLPPLWISIFPVGALETWIVAKRHKLLLRSTVTRVALANGLSTLLGIPLMWSVFATIQALFASRALGIATIGQKLYATTVQAAWLIPYEDNLDWMIPAALLALAVPAYLLSVLIEWVVIRSLFSIGDRRAGILTVFTANAYSYAFLAVLSALMISNGENLQFLFEPFQGITEWMFDLVSIVARKLSGVESK